MRSHLVSRSLPLAVSFLAACGAKSPLITPDVADAAPCSPSPETCNGRDDDCNGLVDDVDVGHDGITDCLRIAVLGNPGRNPSSNFSAWLQSNGARVDRLLITSSPRITPALLAPYNIVLLDWLTREYDASEADALRAWVEAGGGLVSLTGYEYPPSPIHRPNSLLRSYGLAYLDGFYNQPVVDFSPHPTTEGLRVLPFSGGFRVGVLSGNPDTVMVARLPDGPVGAAHQQGRGRVFAWGDEWVEFDSEWRTMPMVRIFWVNVLGWLSHQR